MAVRVLIVDDSVFIRDLIRHHLEQLGCEVVAQADSAAMALEVSKVVHPEIITLDLVMPVVQGIDTLTAFRFIREHYPESAIVVVSAVPFPKTRDAYMSEGAVDYVLKPFSRSSFVSMKRKLATVFPELSGPRPIQGWIRN